MSTRKCGVSPPRRGMPIAHRYTSSAYCGISSAGCGTSMAGCGVARACCPMAINSCGTASAHGDTTMADCGTATRRCRIANRCALSANRAVFVHCCLLLSAVVQQFPGPAYSPQFGGVKTKLGLWKPTTTPSGQALFSGGSMQVLTLAAWPQTEEKNNR